MNYLDLILTILSTLFILYGFARVVFSVGEHLNKSPKTLPTIIFMLLGKVFLLGFIVFNVLSIQMMNDNFMHPTSYLLSGFGMLTIIEVITINKQLSIFDRYLYSNLNGQFETWWKRSYKPLVLHKNKLLFITRNSIHVILVGQILFELFFSFDISDGFYIIVYVFYTALYLLIRRYFNNIS